MAETLSEPGSSSEEAPAAEEAPSPGDSVERSRRVDPMAVLWTFGKCLTALLPVYLAGYYRVSTSLVVFGLVVYSGWKHTREAKEARLRAAMQAVCEEHGRVSLRGAESKRDLPTWVNFPDVEKVEWLNKVLQQAWPFIGQYLEKLLTETIAPSIRASSAHLQTLCFTKIDFGDKAIKVVGVKAHRENEKGQVLLDVYISYVGNVEINVEVKRYFCKAGVKGIQLNGMMRVILEPLIGDIPIVGAVTMFFIRRPKLSINWSGLTNLLDIPGLNVMSDTMIMDAIASYLVLPNRLTVALVPDLHVAQLRSPLPRGVVRIYLLEADNLAEKDSYMKGVIAGKSDPYALIRVGPQTFKSRHQDNTLSPKWGEMYEVIVHEVPGQELEVEVYDKDPDQDDFLGRIKIDLGIVRKAKVIDEWFTLKDVKTGQVHLKLEWLTLEDNTENLEQVLKKNETFLSKTAVPPSAAILTVYLDKAEGLPMKKGNKDPSPKVQISLQDVMRESKVRLIHSYKLILGRASFCLKTDSVFLTWIPEDVGNSPFISMLNSITQLLWICLGGVLRIHLLKGQNLVPKDNMMGGMVKGKSDPYITINVGGNTFKSNVIKENLNPLWNEMYEVVLTDLPGQDISLEVLDRDMDMKDDFMGRLKIKLTDIVKAKHIDEAKSSYLNKAVPAVALLFIYLDSAHDLPVCDRSSSPKWNEAFHFLLKDPWKEELMVKLSHCWDFSLGSVVIPVRELLCQPDLLLDQWLNLDGASPGSQILLRAQLKVYEADIRHTTPDPRFATEGVLRIHLLEAKNLIAKDNLMGGIVKGKSDPYVKISVEGTTFQSHVIKENLNPTWNEMYELVVASEPSSEILVQVFDKDIDKDDFLGRVHISLKEIIQTHYCDQWFSLNDVKHGCIHLVLEWVSTVTQPEKLQQALQLQSVHTFQNKALPSVALLFILIERAKALPKEKGGKEPKAGAELFLGVTSYKTKVCDRSTSPQWGEAFHFLLHNPNEDNLIIKIQSRWEEPLGSLVLSARELLSKPELLLDQWQSLNGAGPESQILLRAQLKYFLKPFLISQHQPMDETHVKQMLNELVVSTVRVAVTHPEEKQSPAADVSHETLPSPQGVLRIHLLEAQNLVAMDSLMGGMVKGKSDPYVKISVGGTTLKSHVIKENLNPTWNEMYEMILSVDPNLEVKFELYDKDIDSDDFLGRLKIKLGDIIRFQYHDEVLQMQNSLSYQNKASPSAALLSILIERAKALPVCDRTTSPQWHEAFNFLIHDPSKDMLVIKMAALVAMGAGPVLSNKQAATTGQIRLSLSYQKKLTVVVHACRSLVTASKEGLDTYVSLILLPDKNKATKRKTAVKKKDLDPEFNERFEFDLSADEARERVLSVCLKHSVSFMARDKDVIGQVQIDLAQVDFHSGVTKW
uniref:Extended synaptotagmin-like protein 1b n=1 Tax=Astyanax mexicanus TaxID=7994 RepID=A0A8B9JF91_ASTMX